MKRATALKYSVEIARRVHAVNGLLATPLCSQEAVRIRRIWVFGSTAKGSQSPNDLDILIDCERVGRRFTWQQTKVNKRFLHSYGIKTSQDGENEALKWLTKGMRFVSRHTLTDECAVLDVKTLIYPRYDLSLT